MPEPTEIPSAQPARVVAPCPWCGGGTRMAIAGNGLGGSFVFCEGCGSRGPAVEIGADFAASDEDAIRAWSTRRLPRPQLAPEVQARITQRLAVHQFLSGELDDSASVSLRYGDVARLLSGFASAH